MKKPMFAVIVKRATCFVLSSIFAVNTAFAAGSESQLILPDLSVSGHLELIRQGEARAKFGLPVQISANQLDQKELMLNFQDEILSTSRKMQGLSKNLSQNKNWEPALNDYAATLKETVDQQKQGHEPSPEQVAELQSKFGIIVGLYVVGQVAMNEMGLWDEAYEEERAKGEYISNIGARAAHNRGKGPGFDEDGPEWNLLAHPGMGANTLQICVKTLNPGKDVLFEGYHFTFSGDMDPKLLADYQYCLGFAFFASAYWEFGPEAAGEQPSIQDLIFTPLLGMLLNIAVNYSIDQLLRYSKRHPNSLLGKMSFVLANAINAVFFSFQHFTDAIHENLGPLDLNITPEAKGEFRITVRKTIPLWEPPRPVNERDLPPPGIDRPNLCRHMPGHMACAGQKKD